MATADHSGKLPHRSRCRLDILAQPSLQCAEGDPGLPGGCVHRQAPLTERLSDLIGPAGAGVAGGSAAGLARLAFWYWLGCHGLILSLGVRMSSRSCCPLPSVLQSQW